MLLLGAFLQGLAPPGDVYARSSLRQRLEENADLVYQESLQALLQLKNEDPLLHQKQVATVWLQVLNMTGRQPLEAAADERLKFIYQSLKLSRDLDQYFEFADDLALYQYEGRDSRNEALAILDDVVKLAKAEERPSVFLRALNHRVSMLKTSSEFKDQLMQSSMELNNFLKTEGRLSEEEKLTAQLSLSVLNNTTNHADMKPIFERLIQMALGRKDFRVAARLMNDLSVSIMLKDDFDDGAVEQLLDQALDFAKLDGSRSSQRNVLETQALLFNYQKNFEKALKVTETLLSFTHSTDVVNLAGLKREKAIALYGLNRYSQSLEVIREIKSNLPETLKGFLLSLTLYESLCYEGLNQPHEALSLYKKFHEIYAEYKDQEINEQYAKISADIGLNVESQKSQILQKENELQAAKIQSGRYLRWAALILAGLLVISLGSLAFAHLQMKAVKVSRRKMKDILDLIEEGIIMIQRDFRVATTSSRFLRRIYPGFYAENDADVLERLFPKNQIGSETQSIYRETLLTCFGEEILSWELNQDQLPRELKLNLPEPKLLRYHWQPAVGADQRVQSFLLSVRDVTKERELELRLEEEKERVHRLQMKVHEVLSGRFRDARAFLERLPLVIETSGKKEQIHDLQKFTRDLHTAKGEARSLGLKGMSQAIHNLESALPKESEDTWSEAWKQTMDELNEYRYLIRDVLAQPASQSERDHSLFDIAAALLPGFKQQLAQAEIVFGSLVIEDQVDHWTPDLALCVRSLLLHALSNAADHGYIFPKRRGIHLPALRLQVLAASQGDEICVQVKDFGVGLDLQKLSELAAQKGFVPAPGQSISEFLFFDGFSTAQEVSQTSGRGVGLSAIRATCRAWKGDARIANHGDGQGSILTMLLKPHSHSQSSGHDPSLDILAS